MTSPPHGELAEAGWRWVLDHVTWDDDGPLIPETVADDGSTEPAIGTPTGTYSGVGGLAYALAEIRLVRDLSADERALADGIATRLLAAIPGQTAADSAEGLAGDIGALLALGVGGAGAAVDRLDQLAVDDGWRRELSPPRYLPEGTVNDVVMGTAGVLLAAVWALRHDVPEARALAGRAADVLLAEAEEQPTGLNWRFVPLRFRTSPPIDMPNFSHGLAGVATALALAGTELGRPDLTEAARRGAEHLITLADTSFGGFVVPHVMPRPDDFDGDDHAFGWCHGPTGTSLLFPALERAGIDTVGGAAPASWERRCFTSVRTSGLPERLHPGFWDNDGRCCGTVGVGDRLLDAWQRNGDPDDRAFAGHLADVLVDRAYRDGSRAWWRFVEHRNAEPLLPPCVGWMQGAAGIAAYLFRVDRLTRDGKDAPAVARLDNWWALPVTEPTA